MALSTILPIASAFLGYKGAQSQAAQQQRQNQLLQEQYEWQKSKEVPGVTGAQQALQSGYWVDAQGNQVPEGTEGATWQSQFQPFVDAAGQTAVAGSNIGQQYLANVPAYQQAGLEGLQAYRNLAGFTPAQQQEDLQRYATAAGQGAYNIAAQDINRDAVTQDRNLARQQGRFGALSSQKARGQAYIDQARTDALLKAAERAQQTGYERQQAELQRQQGLAGALTGAGTSGLAQAQQASQLGQGAAQAGIQAPFQPFQQYGQTVSAQPTASVPQFGTVTDPFSTGIGLGLQSWQAFNPRST